MSAIKTDTQALALALRLAITAPTEAMNERAMRMVMKFSRYCTPAQVKAAKRMAAKVQP